MKKQIFTFSIVMFFGAMTGYSQIDEGNKLVGGSLSFDISSETTENPRSEYVDHNKSSTTQFSITPAVGYFINDHLAIGAKAGYGMDRSVQETQFSENLNREDSRQTQIAHNFQAGPFARYYLDLGKGFYFFGEAEINGFYTSGETKEKNDPRQEAYSSTEITAGIQPGLTFFVNDRVGLFFNTNELLGYHYRVSEEVYEDPDFNHKRTDERERSHLNTNFNLGHLFRPSNLSIGVNVYLD